MIGSLVQNNKLTNLLNNIQTKVSYQIIVVMLAYGLIINMVLVIICSVIGHWLIISGFNTGFASSLIGFFLLNSTSKWLNSEASFKQALAYFGFVFRMIFYATVLLLVIFFKFANIISLIGGFSILMIATITSQLINFKKEKKEK